MTSTSNPTAPSTSTASLDLAEVPNIIDAFGRLFETLWGKSPVLGTFVVVMTVLLPYYAIYSRRTIAPVEKALDDRVKKARKTSKGRAKASSGVIGS